MVIKFAKSRKLPRHCFFILLAGFYLFDENKERITEGRYNNPYFQYRQEHVADHWEYHQNRLLSTDTPQGTHGGDSTAAVHNAKSAV